MIVLSALNINGFLSQNQHKGYEGHGKYLSTTWYLLFSEEKSIILPKYPLKCAVLETQWCRECLRILLFEIIPHDFYNFLFPVKIIRVQRSPLCRMSLWPGISVIGDIVVLRHLLNWMDWTWSWFDAIIPDVRLCWPRESIHSDISDELLRGSLKEIFSESIKSRQIDPQPVSPLQSLHSDFSSQFSHRNQHLLHRFCLHHFFWCGTKLFPLT